MPETIKKTTEIATIDVTLITVQEQGSDNIYALDTASNIGVTPNTETTDGVKLIIKGVLKAQKGEETTVTGNTLTLTDNVFSPELVKLLQGGTIYYWTSAEHTEKTTEETEFGIAGYKPPVTGSTEKSKVFELCAYSAQYDTAGNIVQYEKIIYPNCKGQPIGLSSQDNTFRAPEYTITSAPSKGEAPYEIEYVDTLPTIA